MAFNEQVILERINLYLDSEGLRKERLAKRLGKSNSAFYANLSGKHLKTVFQFAVELAEVLGLPPTFFIEENFQYKKSQPTQIGLSSGIAFSAGELSEEGKRGLEQIGKICDLVNIYY
jgi:transcriptional regulator with XRE-family HTH domain